MDCQHVQQLLPFLDRPSEELDAIERAAAMQHLAICPACTAQAQSERRADEAVARVMRDVPVPADLQEKVLKRLAGRRARLPWKRATAAIAALVLIGLIVGWYLPPRSEATVNDLMEFEQRGFGWDRAVAAKFLADEGLHVTLPSNFDYQYLRRVEIVEFKKRRVAKLTFHADFGNDQKVHAEVLILPHRLFRVDSLGAAGEIRGATNIQIVRGSDQTFAIFVPGQDDLSKIQHQAVQ